jgi:hypothetical protein
MRCEISDDSVEQTAKLDSMVTKNHINPEPFSVNHRLFSVGLGFAKDPMLWYFRRDRTGNRPLLHTNRKGFNHRLDYEL